MGISRDDSGKFLNDYIYNKIFDVDPFVSIDQNGVGELVEIALSRGRKTNKNIKLGICGEHGGDPKSIEFCSRTGLKLCFLLSIQSSSSKISCCSSRII